MLIMLLQHRADAHEPGDQLEGAHMYVRMCNNGSRNSTSIQGAPPKFYSIFVPLTIATAR